MRGTGTTTQQIKAAPKGALYVCGHPYYCQQVAEQRIGRYDLTFSSEVVLGNADIMLGYSFTAIVVDHAVKDTKENHEGYAKLLSAVRPTASKPKEKTFRNVIVTTSRDKFIDHKADDYEVLQNDTLVIRRDGVEIHRYVAGSWDSVGIE